MNRSGSLNSGCSCIVFRHTRTLQEVQLMADCKSRLVGAGFNYDVDFKTTSSCPEMATRPSLKASFLAKGFFTTRPVLKERKREVRKGAPCVNRENGRYRAVRGKHNASSSTQSRNLDMFVSIANFLTSQRTENHF